MLPLGSIIQRHGKLFHCYADDTQLYLPIKTDSYPLARLQACLKDIKARITSHFLLLNSDKTEVIVLVPKHLRSRLSDSILYLKGITFSSSRTARNLVVIFARVLPAIKQVSRTAFFHLHNIAKIRSILSQADAKKRVRVFVTSRPD